MTPEERQKFFSERLEQNKADHTQQRMVNIFRERS